MLYEDTQCITTPMLVRSASVSVTLGEVVTNNSGMHPSFWASGRVTTLDRTNPIMQQGCRCTCFEFPSPRHLVRI